MKTILGLDLGTNSIGWALIEQDFEQKQGKILGMGSRIIPMSQDILGEFGKGNSISQTAERTNYRGVRRLRERYLLRRERLHRVLNIMGYLPEHYAGEIDFKKRYGKFLQGSEPKLAYKNNEFIFKSSFQEMLSDFKKSQPEFLINKDGKTALIPYDWTIYYLRKKALKERIEKEELAWIILNFNQKRGYYQLRGEEVEENPNKLVEFHSLKVVEVVADEPQNGKQDTWYSLHLENGWIYRRSSKIPLFDWKDKVRNFIVTTDLNDDGSVKTDKEGNEKRSFRAPGEDDWTLMKKKTEKEIESSNQTVGAFIYDSLLVDPKTKVKGKLVRTIERKFYREELKEILQKQKDFHPELTDEGIYNDCIRELYRNNEPHQQMLNTKDDFVHLFLEDIIFYQRPLRSQKSSIGNCSLEFRNYVDKDGVPKKQYLKVIPKSNPIYQEFRIWQWMYNLSIYKNDDETNVTAFFLDKPEDWERLYEFLNNRKEIEEKPLIKFLLESRGFKGKSLSAETENYRWNYVKDKKYPCNETKALITARLAKAEHIPTDFLTSQKEKDLWHILYSVTDKTEYEKALNSFAEKHKLDSMSFVDAFRKFPPFKSDYGSFSEKAIKKLLPLLRLGKYWRLEDIDEKTRRRIDKIINGEYDEEIKDRVRDKAIDLKKANDFQGLDLYLAQYIVYGRHSEAEIVGKWNSVSDLEDYLASFKQHSLRNPIVEQVVTETLRVVRDIWAKYGQGKKDYYDEIHIELGRDMKNNADERKRLSNIVTENENTNLRLKALLAEMALNGDVENVRSYSPMQLEILKVYEEGVLNSNVVMEEDILKISRTAQPSSGELRRYKLWLEQKYRSPYTGEIIPLNKLFTTEYEIEHIIPQSRYFDDSLSNKVICESAVNKLKENYIGLSFIKNFHGQIVDCGFGKKVKIFEVAEYEDFVKQHYLKNRTKRNKLLLEEIPEKMIERQMNDTRYISKFISGLLSNIVRAETNDDGPNSKNVLPGNGKITGELKQDWGLNDVWNELILPRFERMNKLTGSNNFTAWNENHQKFIPTVPLEHSKGFSKKRVDHRHHALDALVIACATRDHINFMNNQNAFIKGNKQTLRFDLRSKLCLKKYNDGSNNNYKWVFKKPWENITVDSKEALERIVVSFKQNLRVINKATNHYENWIHKDGKKVKEKIPQMGTNWAIRKPLHKETVSGKVNLARIKVPKGKILTATRKLLDSSFDLQAINSITDTGIQIILKKYLAYKQNNAELAFSPEGIQELNDNIEKYNNGKRHQPITKVRVFEIGSKFPLGDLGNKSSKYVEAAKGTNLFFVVYEDKNRKRSYNSVPLNEVIERQKQGLPAVELKNNNDFYLSPNDLVYIPTGDELGNPNDIDFNLLPHNRNNNIYRVVSFTGNRLYCLPFFVSTSIVNKLEFSKLNKIELTNEKEVCIKLNIDRLGNISLDKKKYKLINEASSVSEAEVAFTKKKLTIKDIDRFE